ncbi:MAG TPA: sulfur transferase domain-containing protein [Pyrinomonadaceae bacterium]|nr:sulfur transferase domain-containing protein [Pyrinomonadaceae bacterium]
MRVLYLVSAMLLFVSCVAAQEDSIKNFLRVNEEFCTGGQPSLQQLEKLKADGVKAIINLRQTTEYAAAEEEAKAKALGLRYFNIPVAPTEPKDEQATEFLKITDDRENRPAFIHCRSAARVSAFWMIRRVLRDGWKLEAAEKEAAKVAPGDHPVLIEFARNYIQRHR